MKTCYRVNEPHVISETMIDETVVINLETGYYYSLNDTASNIWDLVTDSFPLEQIIMTLEKKYQANSETTKKDVMKLINTLVEEALIVPCEGNHKKTDIPDLLNQSKGYKKPHIERHDNIQEMLKLDPIHEVTEFGWPEEKS